MNKHAFITGATGFVGKHLTGQLLESGWRVTALYRTSVPENKSEGDKVTWVKGSLDDVSSLMAAMPDEPFTIFHLAADTTQWKRNYPRQTQTNVGGTKNVLAAAKSKNVQRLIHVSSIAAYGPHEVEISEKTPSIAPASGHNYSVTKWQAEELVRQAVKADEVDAVILNPCHIIGPGDTQNWIQIFQAVKDDKLPGIPPAWGNFGFVAEIVNALINAAEKGRKGESYLLGGPHLAFLHIVQEAQRQLGKPMSKKASPKTLFRVVEPLMRLGSMLTGKEPQLTPDKVKLITHNLKVNDEKSRMELGYRHRPLEEMVSETLSWLKTQA